MADESKIRVSKGDAKALRKEARTLLKKAKKRGVSDEAFGEVQAAEKALDEALSEKKPHADAAVALDDALDKRMSRFRKSKGREYAESILIAVVIAMLLRSFAVELFQIPTGSMEPTLLVGDRLFVSKWAYGVRIPFTSNYLIHWGEVERGDVVVFTFPRHEVQSQLTIGALSERLDHYHRVNGSYPDSLESMMSTESSPGDSLTEDGWGRQLSYTVDADGYALISAGVDGDLGNGDDITVDNTAFPSGFNACLDVASLESDKNYIKRVIGLPGDRVMLRDNIIYVNDEPFSYSGQRRATDGTRGLLAEETMDNGLTHTMAHSNRNPDFEEIVVRDEHVFVMGDNRDNSSDGRCWGQVPIDNIKGRALFILFSGTRGDGFRRERFFSGVH